MTNQIQKIISKIENLVRTHYDVWLAIWVHLEDRVYSLHVHLYGIFPKLIITNLNKKQLVEILEYFHKKYGLWENSYVNSILILLFGTYHYKVYNRRWYLFIKKYLIDEVWMKLLDWLRWRAPLIKIRAWADKIFHKLQEYIYVKD